MPSGAFISSGLEHPAPPFAVAPPSSTWDSSYECFITHSWNSRTLLTLEDCTNDLTSRVSCCTTPIATIAPHRHWNNSTSHHLWDILRPQLAVLVTVTCPLLSAWVRNSSSVSSLYINIYWVHLKILKCNHKFPDQNRGLGCFDFFSLKMPWNPRRHCKNMWNSTAPMANTSVF